MLCKKSLPGIISNCKGGKTEKRRVGAESTLPARGPQALILDLCRCSGISPCAYLVQIDMFKSNIPLFSWFDHVHVVVSARP
jgi:hypothetical protein